MALSLLKHVHFINDTKAKELSLCYLRTKEGQEVDFALAEGQHLAELIEVKRADSTLSISLAYFRDRLSPDARCTQTVMHLRRERFVNGIDIRDASEYLAGLSA